MSARGHQQVVVSKPSRAFRGFQLDSRESAALVLSADMFWGLRRDHRAKRVWDTTGHLLQDHLGS